MKVRKAIKKIVALGTGATLMGATILGAMAADLSDYPHTFIDDGKFDGLLVVGDNAAAEDVVGITNIAMSLQAVSVKRTPVEGGAGVVTVEGDAAEFSRGSDMLEIGENPGDVKGTFTDDDLLLLASGTVSTDKGTTEYNQYLKFNETGLDSGSVTYKLNDDDEADDFWGLTEGNNVFQYELEFEEGLESDVNSNNELEDLEDETITMLGSTYTVTTATVSGNELVLELLGGDVTDTLEEGETKTYTIGDKEYEVKLLIVSDTNSEAKFQINGETTDKLVEGGTDRLSDGLEIGVRDVLPNEAQEESGGDIVEFYLGANKIEFDDSDYTSSTNGGSVEIKEENIEDAAVELIASNTSTTSLEITQIEYKLTLDAADGDPNVAEGEGLRAQLDEPEGMLSEDWDIEFHGLYDVPTTEIKFDSSGDDAYKLSFTNQAGKEYSISFIDNEDGDFIAGEETDDYLHWVETSTGSFGNYSGWGTAEIDEDETFVVTDQDSALADDSDYTYVLKYESIDTDNNELQFSDESDGSTKTVIYSTQENGDVYSGTLIVGGKDYTVYVNETAENVTVDLNGDGSLGDSVDIVAKGGAIIDLGTTDAAAISDGFQVSVITLASEFDGDGVSGSSSNSAVTVAFDNRTNNEAGIASVSGNNTATTNLFSLVQPEGTDDYEYGRDPYGAFYTLYDPSGTDEAEDLTIEYPSEQVGASLWIVSGETSSAMGAAGDGYSEEVQQISVGAVKLASEVDDIMDQNAVVVGGPCANPAASDLLGNPANCVEGFQTGHAMIKLFENDGNVAMLVAGMTAEDTRRASLVVAQYEDYADELVGDEVDVTGTSLSDISVQTPVEETMDDGDDDEAMEDEGDGEGDDEAMEDEGNGEE